MSTVTEPVEAQPTHRVPTDDRLKLKVKIKSLAEEARIIRREEKRCRYNSQREELYLHRIGSLRHEARAAQLAYAFLRGRTLKQVEPKIREGCGWLQGYCLQRAKRMLKKYGVRRESFFLHGEAKRLHEAKVEALLKEFDRWRAA